jgi:hypothetical protein
VKKNGASGKTAGRSTASGRASAPKITTEARWKMIAVAAYHRAESRGFAHGDEVEDWLEAEKEIDRLIAG